MDELSTPPIPESIRAGDQRPQRGPTPPHQLEKRLRAQNGEIETNEPVGSIENSEPEHHLDISV
jgi:hypothetical protein